jgi:hypothetical protein
VGFRLIPTYSHAFTLYLKWQDALLALCWYITFDTFVGCVLIARFLYALHVGHRREMIVLSENALTVRDLSHENLASIFWLVSTSLSCFVAALVGLIPEMLIGWTWHLSSPVVAVVATVAVILLGIASLAVTLPATSFVIIGFAGAVSFFRNLGSPHIYRLTNQAQLSIDNFVLTIMYPDAPESLIELKSLDADDQRHLLHFLRERWIDSQRSWNPQLGDEIEAALEKTERSAVLV